MAGESKLNPILSKRYEKQLNGLDYDEAKVGYHDPDTNLFQKGQTRHVIDDKTHRCIFCGALDERGIVPFLHILGDI